MIDPIAKLSVSRQAIVLGISWGSIYYKPRPVSGADLKLMHRIATLVISPFLTGCIGRIYAAIFIFMAGVMPPMPMLGRSLL